MLVVVGDPGFKGLDQLKRAGLFLRPQALFLQGPHDSLGASIALGVVIAGRGVLDVFRRGGNCQC